MARKKQSNKTSPATHHPGETLEEIESTAERLAQWIAEHATTVAIGVVVLLVGAGGIQTYLSFARSAIEEASDELAQVRADYLAAMGATPGSLDIPELANPEAAGKVRAEFTRRFSEVAESSRGDVQAGLAWLQAANLSSDSGDAEAARAAWQKSLDSLPSGSAIRGVVLQRIARDQEDQGHWQVAARGHQEAAELESYALRFWAMADAARCLDRSGESDRALELLERIETDAPDLKLPDALRARLRELRAARAAADGAGAGAPGSASVASGPQ